MDAENKQYFVSRFLYLFLLLIITVVGGKVAILYGYPGESDEQYLAFVLIVFIITTLFYVPINRMVLRSRLFRT